LRDEVISLRASRKQKALIDRAAEALGKSRSDFMLETACRKAETVLLDRRYFALSEDAFRRLTVIPNGHLLYFLSDRDGYRCIRAQRLDPSTKKPIGAPIEVYHLHFAGRSLVNMNLGQIGLAVARDKIAITVRETSGNIWLRQAAGRELR
jgi:hypothetical protein